METTIIPIELHELAAEINWERQVVKAEWKAKYVERYEKEQKYDSNERQRT